MSSHGWILSSVWIEGLKFLDASMLEVTILASTAVLSIPRMISHSHIPDSAPSLSWKSSKSIALHMMSSQQTERKESQPSTGA